MSFFPDCTRARSDRPRSDAKRIVLRPRIPRYNPANLVGSDFPFLRRSSGMIGRTMAGILVAAVLATGTVACQRGGGSHTHIPVANTPCRVGRLPS